MSEFRYFVHVNSVVDIVLKQLPKSRKINNFTVKFDFNLREFDSRRSMLLNGDYVGLFGFSKKFFTQFKFVGFV